MMERQATRAAEEIAQTAGAAQTAWPPTRAILRVIFIVLAVAALLWVLYALEGVILLVVLSIFFAYLIAPLVEVFRRPIVIGGRERRMPPAFAIGVVYLLFFVSIGFTVYLLLPLLATQVTQFGQQAPTYLAHARDRIQIWTHLVDPDRFPPSVRDPINSALTRTMESFGQHLTSGLTGLLGLLGHLPSLVLIPILAFFLLKDAEAFRHAALQMLPLGRLRWRGADLFRDVNSALASYIRAQLMACLLIGLVCTIGFVLIGVRYALVLGVVAGLLEFIPLVGPLIVAVLATLIAGFYSLGQALLVLVFLAALRIAQDYVIYPRLVGHDSHLHPVAVILGILSGAQLAGMAGIFLAIPVLAVFSIIYRHWLAHTGSAGVMTNLLKPVQPTIDPSAEALPGRIPGPTPPATAASRPEPTPGSPRPDVY